MNKTLKRIIVIAAIVILTPIIFVAGILAMLGFFSRPEVTTDITKYEQIRSGPNVKEEYQERLGLDESIWPNKITDNMEVKDYKMVYWNPFDPQYLGYLVVKYIGYVLKDALESNVSVFITSFLGFLLKIIEFLLC